MISIPPEEVASGIDVARRDRSEEKMIFLKAEVAADLISIGEDRLPSEAAVDVGGRSEGLLVEKWKTRGVSGLASRREADPKVEMRLLRFGGQSAWRDG